MNTYAVNPSAEPSHVRIQLKSRLWLAVTLVACALQLIAPYRGWMVVLIVLGAAWVIGLLWVRTLARGLRLTREMRFGWAQVGDRLEERFTLVNDGWLAALWVEVADHSTLPDYHVSQATGVSALTRNSWRTQGMCTRRGIFTLGPTTLCVGDPFGLFALSIEDSAAATLVVMPQVVALPTIEVAPGGRAGEGRRLRDTTERTVSAARVRDYRAGDDARWIHWRTSARRDALFVRQFDSTPAGDWWIVLDLNQSVQIGEGQHSTLEHAIILAASLTERGLRDGRAVGLIAEGEPSQWLPPQLGDAQRWTILRALTLTTAGARTLNDLLRRAQSVFRQSTSLILITADVSGAWLESLVPLLRRGVVPTVLLLDPVSFGGTCDTRAVQLALTGLGVAHEVITRALLDRSTAREHKQGEWDWRVSGTGRAVAVAQPSDLEWKALA